MKWLRPPAVGPHYEPSECGKHHLITDGDELCVLVELGRPKGKTYEGSRIVKVGTRIECEEVADATNDVPAG